MSTPTLPPMGLALRAGLAGLVVGIIAFTIGLAFYHQPAPDSFGQAKITGVGQCLTRAQCSDVVKPTTPAASKTRDDDLGDAICPQSCNVADLGRSVLIVNASRGFQVGQLVNVPVQDPAADGKTPTDVTGCIITALLLGILTAGVWAFLSSLFTLTS